MSLDQSEVDAIRDQTERDRVKRETGLFAKYHVERLDGKPVAWAFVIQDTDPIAPWALSAYAAEARRRGYHALADDLKAKVREIEDRSAQNVEEAHE